METISSWLVPLGAALAAALSIWNFLQRPSADNAKALEAFKNAMSGRLDESDDRLNACEKAIGNLDTIIKQLPDKDSFHALDKGLTEVRGKIDTISVTVGSAEHSLQRIEQFLINAAQSNAARA